MTDQELNEIELWLQGAIPWTFTTTARLVKEVRRLRAELAARDAEVARLQSALKTIFWMETCHLDVDFPGECPSCLAGDVLGDVLIEYGKQDLLQQLTDLDQSRYQEADNPLVKDDETTAKGGGTDGGG